ncbi:MAG: glycerol-3-phosphate dehydrogenase/oxidase [Anaerolineae bacterium]|nr:glycerol-3-phosphate dehydrogenase/oxidase [Anaerolineae bacterium]
MERNVNQLTEKEYDVLVVGGGIYGATVAWDAALRGLSVALIEKNDFANATSSNSLKTVHGGLRYLQDADIALVRMMIHERMTLMRIAPHLVHPLGCIMPTYNKLMKAKPVMAVALAINNLMCLDRGLPDPQKRLPKGHVVSKEECLKILPGLRNEKLTGGAIWHDAQMYNSERLCLSFILSAVQKGAVAANYVEAVEFLGNLKRVTGVKARDLLTGDSFKIRAKLVINAAGPWVNKVMGFLEGNRTSKPVQLSVAMNMVTRQFISDYAAGIPTKPTEPGKKSQLLFVAPWREYSIVGTKHVHFEGPPEEYCVSEEEIQAFIREINGAYPDAALKREDVYFVHWGFLPAEDNSINPDAVKLIREGEVRDHRQFDDVEGLISVVGVKYTSARYVAKQAVDLAVEMLHKQVAPSNTHQTPIFGGQIAHFDAYVNQEIVQQSATLPKETIRRLILNYGTEYSTIMRYFDDLPHLQEPLPGSSGVLKAEVVYGVRMEMAQKLSDIIFRRTELGSARWPGEACLQSCAEIMALELGWDAAQIKQEIDEVRAIFNKKNPGYISEIHYSGVEYVS